MNGYDKRTRVKMDAIEAAARFLFRTQGFDRTTVEGIAKAAKVSKVSIYHYYGDKAALARKMVMDVMEQKVASFREEMLADLTFRQKIAKLQEAKQSSMEELREGEGEGVLTEALFQDPQMQRYLEDYRVKQANPVLIQLIQQGKREGEVDVNIPDETILLYVQTLQSVLTSSLSLRQRMDMGKLFYYGFKGKETIGG